MAPKRPKDKDIWNKDAEFALISEVERRPVLWDCTLDIYRRADLKLPAFAEIASAIGEIMHNHNITGQIVADRWKSMRSTFMENERRVREFKNKCSGSGTDDVYTPKWIYYNAMKFMRKVTAQAESTSNICPTQSPPSSSSAQPQSSNINVYFNENMEAFQIQGDESIQSISTENDLLSDESMNLMSPPASRPSSAPPSSTPKTSLYERRGKKSNPGIDQALKIMQSVADQPMPQFGSDSASSFGSLVASRLREIEKESTKEARRKCEAELMAVLVKY